MDSDTTVSMFMDVEPTNAVDASIMATVEMMQSCTLRDNSSNASKFEQAQDIDMDVDTPTNKTTLANEMIVESPQHGHFKYKHHHAFERKAVCKPVRAPKSQHKHLKHLVGVDAKSKAPASISSDKVVKASVQHGRSRLGPRPLPTLERNRKRKMESRFAHAVLEAIEEEA